MRILLHRPDGKTEAWLRDFARYLPEAEVVVWQAGVKAPPCDYAVVFIPPEEMLPDLQKIKAIFLTGSGADGILRYGEAIPLHIPVVRLTDAGMGLQMAEYVVHAVLRYYRRFHEYEDLARAGQWSPLPPPVREDFAIGIMGAGVLGSRVLDALKPFGFPLRAWSRSARAIDGVQCFHGADGLNTFLRGTRVAVCMLPLTDDTSNILNLTNMSKMPQGSFVVNVGRGGHLSEPDLLNLMRAGHIEAATLDVFRHEPLPVQHPFWQEPRITITPHVSALTLRRESVQQIAGKMRQMANGEPVADIIDRTRGY